MTTTTNAKKEEVAAQVKSTIEAITMRVNRGDFNDAILAMPVDMGGDDTIFIKTNMFGGGSVELRIEQDVDYVSVSEVTTFGYEADEVIAIDEMGPWYPVN
jgi:hypothetical protein